MTSTTKYTKTTRLGGSLWPFKNSPEQALESINDGNDSILVFSWLLPLLFRW